MKIYIEVEGQIHPALSLVLSSNTKEFINDY